MTALRRFALAAIAAPLSLALAACGSDETTVDGPPTGEAIAHVPAPAGSSWLDTATITPDDGYMVGNPAAPLKLLEYASLTCSHCAEFSKEGAAPLEKYIESGVVSYELRNQIHDGIDLTMAQILRCGDPASFHPLANQVWANLGPIFETLQGNEAGVTAAMSATTPDRMQRIAQATGLLDFFAARGISRDQALQCLADPAKAEAILERSNTQSEKLDVTGTPTFFLNGKKIDVATWVPAGSSPGLESVLQDAGAR